MFGRKWSLVLLLVFTFGSGAQKDIEISPKLKKILFTVLRPLTEINLHFRTSEEALNNFMVYFLNQSVCPVRVFLNFKSELSQNGNNIVVVKIGDMHNLFKIYSSRFGTQFFILENLFKSDEVTKTARAIWYRWGIFKNYFLTIDHIYFYNPFAYGGSGVYGALQDAANERDFVDVFRNLNGYPVRTYIFRSVYANLVFDKRTNDIKRATGADAKVAYSIEKAMNCKMVFQQPDDAFFGHRLPNGTFDGAIGRSIKYGTDLTLTGFFVKDYLTRDTEFSVTVYMDKLCCYVSKAKRIPQSILPLFSVKKDMWLGFIGTAFVWAFIWSMIRKCNLWIKRKEPETMAGQIKNSCQYIRILIDTWVVWVRVNISQYPPFSSEKIFVISLCLVSVIFGAIFESSLATVYINPLYYKDINTLQELDETQFKILIKHAAMKDDLFYGSSSPMFQRLDNKLLYVHEMEDRIIEIMSRRGGFASVTRASSLIVDDIKYILSKKIHQIPECPKTYHIAYILPAASPFRERVDELLLRFLNAGLINHWIEIMYHKARIAILRAPEILQHMGGDTWKVLTIGDLQLAFYVVILGSILSTIVLLFEVFVAPRLRWVQKFTEINKHMKH